MEDIVQWTAPAPLWAAAASDTQDPSRGLFRRPAILRFASDTFMDDLLSLLDTDPARLAGYVAQPETWRGPVSAPPAPARLTGFPLRLSRLRAAAERKAHELALPVPASTATTTAAALEKIRTKGDDQLKLYQPAHGRYYLLAACCVCRVAGLPDKRLDAGRDERTTYIIRRLMTRAGAAATTPAAQQYDEYAFVATGGGNAWKRIDGENSGALAPGEEQLPLFAVNFEAEDGRRRRILAGMIPVGKREAYMGAGLSSSTTTTNGSAASANGTKKTARKILFRTQVSEPWKTLVTKADDVRKRIAADTPPDKPMTYTTGLDEGRAGDAFLKTTREQIQSVSWYVLLDMAKYLKQYLPEVYASIRTSIDVPGMPDSQRDLLRNLAQITVADSLRNALLDSQTPLPGGRHVYDESHVAPNMREALKRITEPDASSSDVWKWEKRLEQVAASYDRGAANAKTQWPDFLFPLADPGVGVAAPRVPSNVPLLDEEDEIREGEEGNALDNVDKLVALVVKALPDETDAPAPPAPLASVRPFDTRDGLFVARCVYERPACGPLDPPVLSDPTSRFRMASFFDPDAPARPVRIALPLDTSLAGLRKFDKNTAFMISDQLCGQIARAKGMSLADLVRSVLPWPLHKDLDVPDTGPCREPREGGLEFGMICSLSIPIITICALILLIIIVHLLDIIFKWVPFFIVCFPLPRFRGKQE